MTLPRRGAAVTLAVALLCACGGAPPTGAPRPHDSNILRADEIAAAQATDAYDAILRLRPRFLLARGSSSLGATAGSGAVRIYVDGLFQRGPDDLRNVSASSIVYIRFLSAIEATTRWGTGFDSPVVYVLTRAGPR